MRPIRIAATNLKIEPSFKSAWLKIYEMYLDDIYKKSPKSETRRTQLLSMNQAASARALDMVNGIEDTRRGMKYELTRFFVAREYVRLYALSSAGFLWLMGDTEPVTIVCGKNSWHVGQYSVAFKVVDLSKGVIGPHFIPLAAPTNVVRHPHHYANFADGDHSGNPLSMVPHTCWGGFGTQVGNSIQDIDIAGLFSSIYKYLCRYNNNSVLRDFRNSNDPPHEVERCEWMQEENSRRLSLTSAK